MFQPAFTVVTTWASNAEEFREKCLRMLESNLIQLYNRWGCEIESCSHDLCAVEHKEESDG